MAAEKKEEYIQIGYTAMRDPATGGYIPATPLYIKADEGTVKAEQKIIEDIGNLFALRIKAYMDGCKEAGVEV